MSLKEDVKGFFDRAWNLFWREDSIDGLAFTLIILILLLKLIFFPLLTAATGTSLPLAIVESCSMYHEGNLLSDLDKWWENNKDKYRQFSIEKENFSDFPMNKGFNKGDILFIVGADPERLEVGDIIIFNMNSRYPIIHRIVEIKESSGERIFSTIGDNNSLQLPQETEITEDQLVGRAVFKVAPYLGWVKLVFFEGQKSEEERGFCD